MKNIALVVSFLILQFGAFDMLYSQDSLALDLGSDTTLCQGDTFLLTSNILADTLAFLWSTGDTTSFLAITENGDYALTISDGNNTVSDTINVLVQPTPIASFTTNTPCAGDSAILVNTSINLQDSSYIRWDFGDGQTLESTPDTVFHLYTLDQDTFLVLLEIANGICRDTQLQSLEVYPVPIVSFSGLAPEYCANDLIDTLIGTPLGGFFFGEGIMEDYNAEDDEGLFLPTFSQENIEIWYQYTNEYGCINADTQLISQIFPAPIPEIIGLDETYCENSPADTLIGNYVDGQFSGPNLMQNPAEASSVILTIPPAGSYLIDYEVENKFGCTESISRSLEVFPLPIADLGEEIIYLEPGNVLTLSNMVIDPDYSFLWSTGETTTNLLVQNPGFYVLNVTNIMTNCSSSDTILVELQTGTFDTDLIHGLRYQNPIRESFILEFLPTRSLTIPLQIFDNQGNQIMKFPLHLIKDYPFHQEIIVGNLSQGTYWLKIGTKAFKIFKY